MLNVGGQALIINFAYAKSKFRSVEIPDSRKATFEEIKDVSITMTSTQKITVSADRAFTVDSPETVYKHYRSGEKVTLKNFHFKADKNNIYEFNYTIKMSVKNKTTMLELLSSKDYNSITSLGAISAFLGIASDDEFRKKGNYIPFDDYELSFKTIQPWTNVSLGSFPDSGSVELKLTRANAPTIISNISFHGSYAIETRDGQTTQYDYY